MPIRVLQEFETEHPYTTLKGKLNMRTLKLVTSIDHMLLGGQGIGSLLVSMDHFKEDYKIGVAVKLQA